MSRDKRVYVKLSLDKYFYIAAPFGHFLGTYRPFLLPTKTGAYLESFKGGGHTLVFWKIVHHSQTFFQLSPISKVIFGLLRGGAWPNGAPKYAPDYSYQMLNWAKLWISM